MDTNIEYSSKYRSSTFDLIKYKGDLKYVPTIFWIHGGAFVAGDKNDVRKYATYIASHGYNVVNINYPLALNDQIFTKFGKIEALNLALTDQPLQMTIKLPGHFRSHYDFKIGMLNEKGESIGQFKKIDLPLLLGGDVNGDDVIDVLDALFIQTYWGTNKRSADINIDGNVDVKDLAFVEKNYLMQNPSVENAPKPKSKYKMKTLEIVKSELGL